MEKKERLRQTFFVASPIPVDSNREPSNHQNPVLDSNPLWIKV